MKIVRQLFLVGASILLISSVSSCKKSCGRCLTRCSSPGSGGATSVVNTGSKYCGDDDAPKLNCSGSTGAGGTYCYFLWEEL